MIVLRDRSLLFAGKHCYPQDSPHCIGRIPVAYDPTCPGDQIQVRRAGRVVWSAHLRA